jgi:hypothetical protein
MAGLAIPSGAAHHRPSPRAVVAPYDPGRSRTSVALKYLPPTLAHPLARTI